VCFCFAIHHHPAMKHAIGPRKALGFPTIFNLLGPLTNPAGATRQLLGVYDRHRATLIAQALPRLGTDKAMVVHGLDGLDEITISASTAAMRIDAGTVTEHEIDPREFGYDLAPLDAIRVDTVDESADLIRRILDGERTPARDVVELNAAAALWTGDAAPTLAAAIDLAQGAISGGAASRTLEQLAVVSHQSG
ncbi:MAG: anthranilate phosphoribosyltransferase, partial [Planctomycetota bacterium]